MNSNNRFYSLVSNGVVADINIYGDITSFPWLESDTSSHSLRTDIETLENIARINVHINSYGGEVAEALAIYNTLKNHPAEVVTYCDGFACSAASVIFMAGDERFMNEASLLLIHNAWTSGTGDANDMRKLADDLDTITNQSKTIYKSEINISNEELDALMDAETWISPTEAVEMGFATAILSDGEPDNGKTSQNTRKLVYERLLGSAKEYTLIERITALIEKCELKNSGPDVSDDDDDDIDDNDDDIDDIDDIGDPDDDKSDDNDKDKGDPCNSWANFFN